MGHWIDFLLLITSNQQFNGVMPSTILFLIVNAIYSNDSILINGSNLLLCGSLLYSFCFVMLTNSYFEKNDNNYKVMTDKYGWLASLICILFFFGANLSLLGNLNIILHIPIYFILLHSIYLFYNHT